VDLTGSVPKILRAGVITADQLRKVVPLIDLETETETIPAGLETAHQETAQPETVQPETVKPAEPHPLSGGADETGS
jgi:hypothetical protein